MITLGKNISIGKVIDLYNKERARACRQSRKHESLINKQARLDALKDELSFFEGLIEEFTDDVHVVGVKERDLSTVVPFDPKMDSTGYTFWSHGRVIDKLHTVTGRVDKARASLDKANRGNATSGMDSALRVKLAAAVERYFEIANMDGFMNAPETVRIEEDGEVVFG